MEKTSVERSIHARKISHPNWIYDTLGLVWKLFVYPKYHVHYTFKKDFRKVEGPFFFISNHASRLDYIFVGAPLLPLKMNFVAGYNEFHRSHLSLVFNLLRVIPKKNFTPDLYTVKEISRVIKSGHGVCIFPEGMSSISGANQPVALGTGKLFKHHKVPVYYSVIRGGYLTSPKYNLRDRVGHVEVEYDQLFTVEDLERMTPAEIESKINHAIYHDDYAWNKIHKHHYDIGENGAEDLEDLLFWCPRCGKQHTMATKGNTIFCTECGNGATLLDTYELVPFDDTCVIPETQTAWFNLEREMIRKEVQREDFILEEIAIIDCLGDTCQFLIDNTAGTHVHVTDFGVAHLAIRKAYRHTGCITLLERACCFQFVHDRCICKIHRVVLMYITLAIAVKNH